MSEKIKVLNLYAGIGGNRKLWPNDEIEVTAVEIDPNIALIYQGFYPNDKIIIADAHEYLLEHYDDGWDFIWSSPPCPTHSKIRNIAGVGRGQNKPVYLDMKLYEEIIFLNQIYHTSGTVFKGKWVVENVVSYYEPLIKPNKVQKHYFWSNFHISPIKLHGNMIKNGNVKQLEKHFGIDLSSIENQSNKLTILRNCVHPKLGLHVFNAAFKDKQLTLSHNMANTKGDKP